MTDPTSVAELLARLQEEAARAARLDTEVRSLRMALDAIGVGVTVADLDGTILYANPAFAAMHGYAVAEVLGLPVEAFEGIGPRHTHVTIAGGPADPDSIDG